MRPSAARSLLRLPSALGPLLFCGVLAAAACSPYEPPVVEASALTDTLDTRGPYQVAARVSSRRSISLVELVWHNAAVGAGQAIHVTMVDDGSGVFRAVIPGSGQGAVIAYHVEAEDQSGDRGYWPEAAASGARCGQEECFTVLPAP